jgi:hypothetical protein
MNAFPLNQPLQSLLPVVTVFVIRAGLALPYPAGLLLDIANDRYVVGEGPTPNNFEFECGDRLAERLSNAWQPVDPAHLRSLTLSLWRNAGGGLHAFDLWWESVNLDSSPAAIGTAAMVAARTMMTVSLFSHRCGIDVSAMVA